MMLAKLIGLKLTVSYLSFWLVYRWGAECWRDGFCKVEFLSPDGWLTVPAIRVAESRRKMRQFRILLWPGHFRLRSMS